MSRGPLDGYRIVEFAGIGPAPFAGMLLADLGADVVVLGRAAVTGIAAMIPPQFHLTNRGKRLLTADLKTAVGRDLAFELVTRAHGLIEGFRPGVMERLGLGPDVVERCNPRLVYTRVTGWGQTGPRTSTAGHDLNYIALAGALGAMGRSDGPPLIPLNLLGDYAGGSLFAVIGTLAALLEAGRSGRGQVVDAAMVDGVTALLGPIIGLLRAGAWTTVRGGNLLDGGAPFYDTYRTRDGKYVALGALEDQFFAILISKLQLNPSSAATRWDRKTWEALRDEIGGRVVTKTRAEWEEIFAGTDACFAPVLDLEEAATHPDNEARSVYVTAGGVSQPAPAPRFSRTPAPIPPAPVSMASDPDQILREWST
ncbi:MAG: CaiB/BaiF CoA-transferase family protein [Gemmatimonadota bacterium]